MKWALVTAISVALAIGTAQAAEEKILYCVDTASSGFSWKNGTEETANFKPIRNVVKVHANGDRTIGENVFNCTRLWPSIPGPLECVDRGEIWHFTGNNFTRAYVVVVFPPTRDDNLYVAYGTCTDF
jgi:hypothetical protein